MSDGHYCVVRDLGLVKGGKGMRHHEVVIGLSLRELLNSLRGSLRNVTQRLRTRTTAAGASEIKGLGGSALASHERRGANAQHPS
jgi:hypothetical protein